MEDFFKFAVEHWLLCGLFLVFLVAYIIFEIKNSELGSVAALSPEKAVDLINHHNALVLDVRSPELFKTKKIVGSVNITAQTLQQYDVAQWKKFLSKYGKKPVIVVCNLGKTAAIISKKLREHGHLKVFELAGGISAWQTTGFPVVAKAAKKASDSNKAVSKKAVGKKK